MLIHQDGSTHQWVPGWYSDLIVTMDDATSEHYSMFLVEEEGTVSNLRGVVASWRGSWKVGPVLIVLQPPIATAGGLRAFLEVL